MKTPSTRTILDMMMNTHLTTSSLLAALCVSAAFHTPSHAQTATEGTWHTYQAQASYEHGDEKVTAVNDQQLPKHSRDASVPRHTFWPHKGSDEWLVAGLGAPQTVNAVSVYWFDDQGGGGCATPANWQLLYHDGQQWQPVRNATAFTTQEDTFNTVFFDAVQTQQLKIELTLQEGKSGGVLEWRVGHQEVPAQVDLTPEQMRTAIKAKAQQTFDQDLHEFNSYGGRPRSDGPINKGNVHEFLNGKVPMFICSDEDITEVYNYRWWMISKHLRKWKDPIGGKDWWVFTEFFGWPGHASRSGAIPCPAGHQFYDLRWMRDTTYTQNFAEYYMGGPASTHNQVINHHGPFDRPESHHYSSWMVQAMEAHLQIHPNPAWRDHMLPHMEKHQQVWDEWWTVKKPGAKTDGLYKILDLYDGNEFTISATLPLIASDGAYAAYTEENWRNHYLGWRTVDRTKTVDFVKTYPDAFGHGYPLMYMVRPSINAYMWGNLDALANLYQQKAAASNQPADQAISDTYRQRADALRDTVLPLLWNEKDQFFYSWTAADNNHGVKDWESVVRESVGYTPWYFNMIPEGETTYDKAWEQFNDSQGFLHNKGMTTAEIRSPLYDEDNYAWNGRGWLFQNSVCYKAYANYLRNRDANAEAQAAGRDLLYKHIDQYVTLHGKARNIREHYLPSRSNRMGGCSDYFHSTFPDTLIADLLGFMPSHDNEFTLSPLLPEGQWDYFYLGDVRYHGHDIDIIWKKDWDSSQAGNQSALHVWIDGKHAASSSTLLEPLTVQLPN